MQNQNRWFIATMGTLLQLCIGTVYAWSFFQKPLVTNYQWGNTSVAWVFSLTIVSLSIAAAIGGSVLPTYGPRKLAITGGALFGAGYLIGGFALSIKSLVLLYIGYGLIGGFGIGLAYVTPVATVSKWFPDKKGLATGMVIMGFGLGAMLMSKVFAPILMASFDGNLTGVFFSLGIIFLLLTVPIASFMVNPPEAQEKNSQDQKKTEEKPERKLSLRKVVCTNKFIFMWLIFFCNITAGIMFIGFQSPMLQDLLSKESPAFTATQLASYGATLIAISSIFNGVGRFFWGSISDHIGRLQVFRVMLGSLILVFIGLIFNSNSWIFGILVCYVLLCYGGGFGTMPSFIHDIFGSKLMASAYGVILTAWGAGGIVGPQLVAIVKDSFKEQASVYAYSIGGLILAMGLGISFLLNDEKFKPLEHHYIDDQFE